MNGFPETHLVSAQRGIGLIELMVAMVIGLFLLGGTITLFSSNKKSYEVNDDLSRLQENARFAMEFIAKDLRMAGYFGCMDNPAALNNNLDFDTVNPDDGLNIYDTRQPVDGYEEGSADWDSGASHDDDQIGNMVVDGGGNIVVDGITIRYLSGRQSAVTAAMSTSGSNVTVAAGHDLEAGDVVIISDCASADVFQVTAVAGNVLSHTDAGATPDNTGNLLSKAYGTDAVVGRLVAVRYTIQDNANGIPSLFRTSFNANGGNSQIITQELVEGVENMQVMFGEDTAGNDGIPDTYVNTDAVTDWADVVSVRIGMLGRTVDQYDTIVDNQNIDLFSGVRGCADDAANPGCVPVELDLRVQRRAFTTTVLLRNIQ